MKRWLLVLVAIVLLPVLAVVGFFFYEVEAPGSEGKAVKVTIQRGWGSQEIGDELEHRGVIGSSFAFTAYVKVAGRGPFRAGEYDLHQHMGASKAASALERPPEQKYQQLKLPPGLTLAQIADRVGALKGFDRSVFLALARSNTVRSEFEPASVRSLEGLTWPDTYFIAATEDEQDVLRRLVMAFDDHATRLGLSPLIGYPTVIVASLIQTEAKLDSDRPLISAVIANRLRGGMPLQIDATLLYARGSTPGPITDADRASPSPYNTYKTRGLPPTPISTVSAASLTAAMHPAAVPYLYYVLIDADGKHAFATTYAEHQRNVAIARSKGLLG